MRISTLIFDLDGTLSDPLLGMAKSINYALSIHGFEQRPVDELAQYIGPPLEETFVQLSGSNDNALLSRLIAGYREQYIKDGYSGNTVYEGIPLVLQKLQHHGRRMGVCTSKQASTARKILKFFELDGYFEFVSGGDVGVKKAHQLAQLLGDGEIDHDALMVGDRAVDVDAAKSNRLASAAVTWGFGSRSELDAAQPDFQLQNPHDILHLVGCAS